MEVIGRNERLAYMREIPSLDKEAGRMEFLKDCQSFQPDVVVIDPLPIAWPVSDENDNAEADRQMTAVKNLAKTLNCVIIVMWNMGEGNIKEKFKARGATARIDRADLTINYKELTDTTRQLKVVKSRYSTLNQCITVRFAGELGFEAVEGQSAAPTARIPQLQAMAREALTSGRKTRQELIALSPGEEDLMDKAMSKMFLACEVTKPERAVYELAVSSESPNLMDSGIQKQEATTRRILLRIVKQTPNIARGALVAAVTREVDIDRGQVGRYLDKLVQEGRLKYIPQGRFTLVGMG